MTELLRAAEPPDWERVLVVVAHPDDESFGLGAVIEAFTRRGAAVAVLCLTRGEASTVHGVDGDLGLLRRRELSDAARLLGVSSAVLRDHPDGALASLDRAALVAEVRERIAVLRPDGLLVFDPSGVTGHPDHTTATEVAREAARADGLPVLGWTLPLEVAEALNTELGTTFVGHDSAEVDLVLHVDRSRQRAACRAHASQAIPTSVLWRRLELLGDLEHLRWLERAVRP